MNYVKTTIELADLETVEKARKILESKDLDLEDCVLAFLEQVIQDGNFPFELTIKSESDPTTAGMVAMVEMARHPEDYKRYSSYQEAVDDVMKEEK